MSEQVLGFIKKDAEKGNKHGGKALEPRYYYNILEEKLVPVVSLKELEEYCKEKYSLCNQDILNLLSWAREKTGVKDVKKQRT